MNSPLKKARLKHEKTLQEVADAVGIDTGRLGKQQQTILGKVQAGRDYSLRELAALSGLEINAVSGRVNDLKKLNLLVEGEKRSCTVTGKTITPVKLPAKQGELFQ